MHRTAVVALILIAVLCTLSCSPLGGARAVASKAVGQAIEEVQAEATEQAGEVVEGSEAVTGEGQGGPSGPVAACYEDFPAYGSGRPSDDAAAMARILGASIPEGKALGFVADDGWEQVRDFYLGQAPDMGWEQAPLQGGDAAGNGTTLWWGKDSRLVMLFIANADEGTGSTVAMVCGKGQS